MSVNFNNHNIVTSGSLTALSGIFNSLQVDNGHVVFNDGGGNFDFRVEGDTNQNLFFTDASNDTVNIGTGTSTGNKLLINANNTRSYAHILASGVGICSIYRENPSHAYSIGSDFRTNRKRYRQSLY